jgi:hypothetical protein
VRGRFAAAAGSLLLAGCATGFIYTQTTRPLTLNFHETPSGVGERNEGEGDVKRFRYYVDIMWDSNAIGRIAKEHGFETVYYADLETLSVLGIWNQRFVHVYGK